MSGILVAMDGISHYTRQQAWDQSLRRILQHGPYQPSPPTKKDPHPNRKWMARRQWFLGQLLLLLFFLIPEAPERLHLEHKIRNLVDLLKLHAGQQLENDTRIIIDDSSEASLYFEVTMMMQNARVTSDIETSCLKGAWDTTARIAELEGELVMAKRIQTRWRSRVLEAQYDAHYTHSEATTRDTPDGEWIGSSNGDRTGGGDHMTRDDSLP